MYLEKFGLHTSLISSCTSSKGQIPRFHTLGFVWGIEAKLDENRKAATMFQQEAKYNVQMTNILFRHFDLEIKTKHIIEEKDRSIQNMQGALEKE